MTDQNKFQPIHTTAIYGDGIGHVTLYDASHANESEDQRIWTVTQICSLAYGNEEAKNPEALYARMKSIKHESLWEFIRYGEYSTSYYNKFDRTTIESSMRNFLNGKIQHWYPSESVDAHTSAIACFRIKVPIFVARQFMRHRSFSYLEMSRRYTKDAKVPFEFWFPQGFAKDMAHQHDYVRAFQDTYNALCYQGLHTQVASRFLPQTTYTEFYIMGEVEGLKNFFTLRCAKEAQEEIREVAITMLQLIAKHQPELYKKVLP